MASQEWSGRGEGKGTGMVGIRWLQSTDGLEEQVKENTPALVRPSKCAFANLWIFVELGMLGQYAEKLRMRRGEWEKHK